jgi:hypothetical protein
VRLHQKHIKHADCQSSVHRSMKDISEHEGWLGSLLQNGWWEKQQLIMWRMYPTNSFIGRIKLQLFTPPSSTSRLPCPSPHPLGTLNTINNCADSQRYHSDVHTHTHTHTLKTCLFFHPTSRFFKDTCRSVYSLAVSLIRFRKGPKHGSKHHFVVMYVWWLFVVSRRWQSRW